MTRKFLNSVLLFALLVIWMTSCSPAEKQTESKEDELQQLIELKPGEVPPPADFSVEDLDFGEVESSEVEGEDSIPDIDDFVLLDKEPVPLNLDEIKGQIGYPKKAKDQELEGKVVVRILLDRQGKYVKHSLLIDPHPVLSSAVTAQIPNLNCTPGMRNGRPLWCWITVPFDFRLIK
jgi:TonB family protein